MFYRRNLKIEFTPVSALQFSNELTNYYERLVALFIELHRFQCLQNFPSVKINVNDEHWHLVLQFSLLTSLCNYQWSLLCEALSQVITVAYCCLHQLSSRKTLLSHPSFRFPPKIEKNIHTLAFISRLYLRSANPSTNVCECYSETVVLRTPFYSDFLLFPRETIATSPVGPLV